VRLVSQMGASESTSSGCCGPSCKYEDNSGPPPEDSVQAQDHSSAASDTEKEEKQKNKRAKETPETNETKGRSGRFQPFQGEGHPITDDDDEKAQEVERSESLPEGNDKEIDVIEDSPRPVIKEEADPPPSKGNKSPPSKKSKKNSDKETKSLLDFDLEFKDIYENKISFNGVTVTDKKIDSEEEILEMLLLYNDNHSLADCRVLRRFKVETSHDWIIEFVGEPIRFVLEPDIMDEIKILALLRVKVDKKTYQDIRPILDDIEKETFSQPHRENSHAEFVDLYSDAKYVRRFIHCRADGFQIYLYYYKPAKYWTLVINDDVWFEECEVVSINQEQIILNGIRDGKRSSWNFELKADYSKRQVNGILKQLYELPSYKEIHENSKKLIVCDWGALAGSQSDRSVISLQDYASSNRG